MPTVFAVIGCHRHDPEALLLQGDDGRRYIWASPASEPVPIDTDRPASDWSLDRRDRDDDTVDAAFDAAGPYR